MGRFDGVILTSKGLRLQAKAQTGIPLVIKSVVVGDGYLPEGTDVIQMTSLINQIADAHTDIISNEVKSDGFTYLEARISSGEAAFFLREIGIIATDPDEGDILYAYANADDYADFIPASDESVTIQDITLVTAVGNAENIEVNVSISAGISRNDFENLKAQLTELKETVESKPHVAVVYRNEPTPEPNTLYVILDEDKPGAEAINTVVYDNVVFDEDEPETPTENWFQTEGGETNVNSESEDTEGTKIIMQNGKLTVLKEPEADTTFLSD